MKYAISGSHGVGKSTLIEELKKQEWIVVYDEVARRAIEKCGKFPHEMTTEEQGQFEKYVLDNQIMFEISADKKKQNIFDRGVLDVLAYSVHLKEFIELKREAISHILRNPYDVTFYIPIEFPMEGDWVRKEDEAFRTEIDGYMRYLLDVYGGNVVEVRWSVQERVNIILNFINKWEK